MTWSTLTDTILAPVAYRPALDGLPPHPAPTLEGAPVRWVELLDDGPLYYKGKPLPTDRDTLERVAANVRRLAREGYLAPQLAEHAPNGERLGHLLAVEVWRRPETGRDTLIGALQFNDVGAEQKLAAQQIYYFSPALGAVEDGRTGDVVGPTITEVSRVSKPHRKTRSHVLGAETTGAIMDPMTGAGQAPEAKPEGADLPGRLDKLEAQMSEMGVKLGALSDSLAALMEGMSKPEPEPEDAEMGEVKARLEAAEAKLAEAEAERARAQAQAWLAEHRDGVIRLSEASPDDVLALITADGDAFKRLCARAGDKTPPTPPPAPPVPKIPGPTANPFGTVALGEGGGEPPAVEGMGKTITRTQLRERAAAEKVRPPILLSQLKAEGYTLVEDPT